MYTKALLLTGYLAVASVVLAGESAPAFSSKPKAARAGDKVTVEFGVSRSTDVAVYVLDARGKCIRHLAAGVLGGKQPPPAPLKAGLSQSLEWDGKDDYGKPAAGGPFKVRVALGLKPEFAGFINWHPDALPKTVRVAVGPKGNVYYFYQDMVSNYNMGGHKLKVRSRDGKHLRTLVPFPGDIGKERHKVYGAFTDDDGHVVPRIHNWESMSLNPTAQSGRRRDTNCNAPAVDSKGRIYWTVKGEHLVCVDAEGRSPYDSYLGKPIFDGARYSKYSGVPGRYLAVSGDDKYVYVSGVGGNFNGKKQTRHCVYRVDTATRGKAKPFVGDPDKAGDGKNLLKSPRGVAAAKGLLYVADTGNNRVIAFKESDGAYVGETKIPAPNQVCVNKKTGELYVICSPRKKVQELRKFAGIKAAQSVQVKILPKGRGHTMALDDSAKPVRLYFPHRGGLSRDPHLACLEDAPNGFKTVEVPKPKGRYAFWQKDMTIDPHRGELYIKAGKNRWDRFDAETGAYKNSVGLKGVTAPSGGQLVVDSQGRLITYRWVHKSHRPALSLWTREGKPIPTKGAGWSGLMNFQQNYMDISRDELYVIPNTNNYMRKGTKGPFSLTVFGLDLQPKRTAVWQCSRGAIVKLDSKGNIYMAENVRPLDRVWPKFFDGKLPKVQRRLGAGGTFWYSYMYGSVVKFSPKGGALWFDGKKRSVGETAVGKPGKDVLSMPERPFRYCGRFNTDSKGVLQGAEWVRFGFSPYSNILVGGGGTSSCMCEGASFDVDGFGRVFYPNLGRFRVEVIDNNNNMIGTFGKYGNADSQLVPSDSKDGKPLLSTPAIPLCWPTNVATGDNFAYVGDLVSMRTVKVKLGYRAEETCPLP